MRDHGGFERYGKPSACESAPADKMIGIVGCSAEGAALCYRTICAEGASLLGPHAHPEISMHTPSFARHCERLEREDWDGVAALMLDSANRLARMGCDFLICPDNTIHQALPLMATFIRTNWRSMGLNSNARRSRSAARSTA
jgi:aspartate/glutamate racemase